MFKHIAHFKSRVTIILIGAGGTGSQILSGLARLDRALRSLGRESGLDVFVFDDDTVSKANIGRQLFHPQDVGLNKADVLTSRINMVFGTSWVARRERFCAETDFKIHTDSTVIVVGAVDTKKSRQEISAFAHKRQAVDYWIDTGNKSNDGQVVLGQPLHEKSEDFHMRLPTVLELFPDMLDEDNPEDDVPSCSLAEALDKQDLFINQSVATHALNMLWTLFRYGGIDHSVIFLNMRNGMSLPLQVSAENWLRFGHCTRPESKSNLTL